MTSLLQIFRQRKMRLIVLLTFSMLVMSVYGVIHAQETTSAPACAVTPNMLGGQGFSVSGQGFSVSGQGFSVSGQGFSVSGQGFSVSGQGFSVSGQSVNLDPLAVAAEIRDNPVTVGQWTNQRLDFFTNRLGFNTDATVILVVDDFSAPDAHGFLVQKVAEGSITEVQKRYQSLNADNPPLKISVVPVNIAGVDTQYNADEIADRITEAIAALPDVHHFVLNMSFGLISCTSPATTIGGVAVPAFDFQQAIQTVAANNQPDPILGVTPILECVVRSTYSDDEHEHDYEGRSRVSDNRGGSTSGYIAYFGYQNDNAKLTNIAVGSSNFFSGRYQNHYQPTQFEPGRQKFVFKVKFSSSSSLTWSVTGPDGVAHTVTANSRSPLCNPTPAAPSLPVVPVVECVADLGDNMYEARFGYNNPNAVGKRIAVGYKNKFLPDPADRQQIITFSPGTHKGVFEVYFDGTDLKWTLDGTTVTANAESAPCFEQVGFGINQYLTQNLGVPANLVSAYWNQLASSVATDDFQKLRKLLNQYLIDSNVSPATYSVVTVASSGNLRPWMEGTPLAPAVWNEAIAVGATLDNSDKPWSFSQDGNVLAPGAGYVQADGSLEAGTSFAAPTFSVLAAMCSTVPNGLQIPTPVILPNGEKQGVPPLVLDSNGNKTYGVTSAFLVNPNNLTPFTCSPNRQPTINSLGDRNDKAGTSVSFSASASDPDGDTLKYSAAPLPTGITIDPNTGLISGTIASNVSGSFVVVVTASDGRVPEGKITTTFNWVVTPAEATVRIDIRPFSSRNRINLGSRGLVAVAIFGSSTFDATSIDPSTVTLAGAPAVKLFNKYYSFTKDLDRDGKTDRVLWFRVQQLQLTPTSTQAVLLGKTIFGAAFRGVDSVTIVPPRPPRGTGPSEGWSSRDSLVKLTWADDEDWEVGDNVCYSVQISKSTGFSTIIQSAIVVDQETMITAPLNNGTYYWRAAFSDCSSGLVSPWSATGSFKVQR